MGKRLKQKRETGKGKAETGNRKPERAGPRKNPIGAGRKRE